MDADTPEVVAHHEAGHACAAILRGGASITSIHLDPVRPGYGMTHMRAKAYADGGFIAWAGCWAEARYRWGDRPLDQDDDDGLEFVDHVQGVLLEQPGDRADVIEQEENFARLAAMAPGDEIDVRAATIATYQVWHIELEQAWPAMQRVAELLLAGATVTDAQVRALVDTAVEAN
ncbi:hypothetical protein [Rhodococcus koreensis]